MKSTYRNYVLAFFLAGISLGIIVSCKKEGAGNNASGKQQLSVYLTDDPFRVDTVLIDIKTVEVKLDTSEHRHDDHFGDHDANGDDDHLGHDAFGQWDTLAITPGIYNVASLRNGIDTLLASGNITGEIRKIRITLGSGNSLVVNDTSYPLLSLPGTNQYLYVQINKRHHQDNTNNGTVALWIDFDISRSIVYINGQYYLRPVLRPFCDLTSGTIEGRVLPEAAQARIVAYNGTDSSVAIPDRRNGYFRIRGLVAGTYNLSINGNNGYGDTLINHINVQNNQRTTLPVITLHQ